MSPQDKTITCFDCGLSFTFSAVEQELFASIGRTHSPKRCPACRQARKAHQSISNSSNQSKNSFRSVSARPTFHGVCDRCGKDTEVPFQPRAGQPLYCKSCYNMVKVNR